MVGQILDDLQWGIRHYQSGQQTFVLLFISNDGEDNSETNNMLCSEKKRPMENNYNTNVSTIHSKMVVEWHRESITDAQQHTASAGFISIHFQVEQAQFI